VLFKSTKFSQTLGLVSFCFEAYTGTGAVANEGEVKGSAGTNDGIISGEV
jgi:hypothetical protein